jgi:enolase
MHRNRGNSTEKHDIVVNRKVVTVVDGTGAEREIAANEILGATIARARAGDRLARDFGWMRG